MFESIINFFKKIGKHEPKETGSKDKAKERLHLVLMQDRANVSADFLEMMKQEIIEVIKKYIEVEEDAIDVRLTNEIKEDGTTGAPSLYANIPILNIRNEMKKEVVNKEKQEEKTEKEEEEQEQEQDNKDEEKIEAAEEAKQEEKENDINKDNKEDKTEDEKEVKKIELEVDKEEKKEEKQEEKEEQKEEKPQEEEKPENN